MKPQPVASNGKHKILEMGTQFGVGGITRHVLDLRTWFSEKGHHISLAGTGDVWANSDTETAFLDLPTRYVGEDGGNILSRLGNAVRAAFKLRRWLRANSVDLIHAHESAPALVAHLARMGLGIPLVVTYHGSEQSRVAQFGRIARLCDLVITPSHRAADDLAKVGQVPLDKLKVIGLGVPLPKPLPPGATNALRAELLGDGKILIITIARMTHQKGVDVLIECITRLKYSHPQMRFALVGDGPLEQDMRTLAEEKDVLSHLTFVGRVDGPHIYLRAADLMLLTSRWEALPITIVESFQSATPVVATSCSGVVELVDDTVGACVNVGNIDEICKAIIAVTENKDSLKAMSDAAVERSKEDRFDPDWVHQQFEKTYSDLIAKGRS